MSSKIRQIAQEANASHADVIRVLNHGGTTQADWDIAHAIEQATGRSAYELMLLAGREEEVAQIWADSRAEATPVAPTNPLAKTTEGVKIYPEQTSPDESREVVAHHPGDDEEAEDSEQAEVAKLRTLAWAAVANLTRATRDAIDRMVAKWASRRAVHSGFTNVLRSARSRRAARLRETYVTAA